jgi:hypothetical protein
MYLALDNVHPVTLAVGNTAKRVFIIVASLVCATCGLDLNKDTKMLITPLYQLPFTSV